MSLKIPRDRTFQNRSVKVTEIETVGPDSALLQELIFEDCLIQGPVVIMPLGTPAFVECEFESPHIFWVVTTDRPYFGVVGMRDCRFERCRFVSVGIAASQEVIDQFLGSQRLP
jgi:hypothetical protein